MLITVCVSCSTFTLTFALPAASSFSVPQFLKTYEDEFLEVVNPKLSLLKLKHKGVISADVRTAIESANDEDAKYILLEHLQKNATVDTLKVYCDIATAANGFPRMQELGRKMVDALQLPTGGWLDLWMHNACRSAAWCMSVILCVFICVHVFACACICMYYCLWLDFSTECVYRMCSYACVVLDLWGQNFETHFTMIELHLPKLT